MNQVNASNKGVSSFYKPLYGTDLVPDDLKAFQKGIYSVSKGRIHGRECQHVKLPGYHVKGDYVGFGAQNGEIVLCKAKETNQNDNDSLRLKLWNGLVNYINPMVTQRSLKKNEAVGGDLVTISEGVYSPGRYRDVITGAKPPKNDGTAEGDIKCFLYNAYQKLRGDKNSKKPLRQYDVHMLMSEAFKIASYPEMRIRRDVPLATGLEKGFVLGLVPGKQGRQNRSDNVMRMVGRALKGPDGKPIGIYKARGYQLLTIRPNVKPGGYEPNGVVCVLAKMTDIDANLRGKINGDEFNKRCKRLLVQSKDYDGEKGLHLSDVTTGFRTGGRDHVPESFERTEAPVYKDPAKKAKKSAKKSEMKSEKKSEKKSVKKSVKKSSISLTSSSSNMNVGGNSHPDVIHGGVRYRYHEQGMGEMPSNYYDDNNNPLQ